MQFITWGAPILSIAAAAIATSTTAATARAQTIGHYTDVHGLRMYYEIHGAGFPLVLIHGGGSTIGSSFGRILPDLARSRQVIAVELQAHGHTADIDRPLSFDQDADDVAELLRQLGIAKANVFGFSNGASTTLKLAIRHPQLVNRIVVASTMYTRDGAYQWLWDGMSHPSFSDMPQQYKDAYLAINPDSDALHRMYERDVARMQSFRDISDADIESISAPTLIMIGDRDVVRPEHAVQMSRHIKNSRLAIVPGAHGAYIGELATLKPGDSQHYPALQIIQDFLDGRI